METIFSTVPSRLRVPLAKGSVLMLESSPEGAPRALRLDAPREEEEEERFGGIRVRRRGKSR